MNSKQEKSVSDEQMRKVVDKFAFLRVENNANNVQTTRMGDKFAFLRGDGLNSDFDPERTVDNANMSRPRQIGCFGEMESGKIQTFDRRELKAFRPPISPTKVTRERSLLNSRDTALESMDLNLTAGIDSWIEWDEGIKDHDNRLINWILHNRQELSQKIVSPTLRQCCENAEFVCSRYLLVDLAFTVYRPSDWAVKVVRWQNVFFLVKVVSPVAKTRLFMTEAFRNLCACEVGSESSPWENPRDPVDTTSRFSVVLRADIGTESSGRRHRLLNAGVIDCIDEKGQYIALKVNTAITEDRELRGFYRYKMLSLGLRCCFTGIDRLVIGFHKPEGELLQIGEFDVRKIPEQAASALGSNAWKPSVCMNFIDSFLTQLKERITENDINAVYQVKFTPPLHPGAEVDSSCLQFERLVDVGEGGTGFEYLQSIFEHFR